MHSLEMLRAVQPTEVGAKPTSACCDYAATAVSRV